jgi:hypothetical protein
MPRQGLHAVKPWLRATKRHNQQPTQKEFFIMQANDFRYHASQLLLKRMGLSHVSVPVDVLNRYGLSEAPSLRELARVCISEDKSPNSLYGNPDLTARAMTTSDFQSLLSNVGEKSMQAAFALAPATWQAWASKGTLPNFKETSVVRVDPPGLLSEVKESDEYKYLRLMDADEKVRIKTFGGIAGITRQAIINDDLNGIKDMTRILAVTAASTSSRCVYGALLDNAALSDGTPVFDSTRGNLLDGTDSALSRDSLAAGLKVMRTFASADGIPLAVEPKFLLVPPSLEMTAHELCFSDSIPGQSNPNIPNLFKKLGITPVVEPLLESSIMSGGSSSAWYLLPDPGVWPFIRVYGLTSESVDPVFEEKPAWNSDRIEYKVRMDLAVGAIGHYAVKSLGV